MRHRCQIPSLLQAAASPLITGCDWGAQEKTALLEELLLSVELVQPSFTISAALSLTSSTPRLLLRSGPRLALSSPSSVLLQGHFYSGALIGSYCRAALRWEQFSIFSQSK